MKKTLVIIGHPNPSSFCHALAQTYAQATREQGAAVEVLDLAKLNFDPILHEGYQGKQPLEPDLQRAQELLTWCEHLCLATPLWWGASPALLKGFFDRTLQPGFAFKYDDNPIPQKLLSGRSGRLLFTSDSPTWYSKFFMGDSAVKAITHSTLGFCGFKPVRVTRFESVRTSNIEKRSKWLEQTANISRKDQPK